MQAATLEPKAQLSPLTQRYAKCIDASKRVRWDIDRDVLRDRVPDFQKKFMPDSLSRIAALPFLRPSQARLYSQVQGRTYANMFGMIERYIGAKTLEITRDYALGDQVAMEALIRFTDEELKHQELFRRVERLCASGMPPGYRFVPDGNAVASVVLGKSTWAVLGLTCHIELFTQTHYRASIEPDGQLSELWKDVFLFHWKEESQHAILDELEWRREDAKLAAAQRDRAVGELIELVAAIDGMLQAQAGADAEYFIQSAGVAFSRGEQEAIRDGMLKAYRWQYIVSGAQEPRFVEVLTSLVTPAQMERIGGALAPIAAHAMA